MFRVHAHVSYDCPTLLPFCCHAAVTLLSRCCHAPVTLAVTLCHALSRSGTLLSRSVTQKYSSVTLCHALSRGPVTLCHAAVTLCHAAVTHMFCNHLRHNRSQYVHNSQLGQARPCQASQATPEKLRSGGRPENLRSPGRPVGQHFEGFQGGQGCPLGPNERPGP